MKKLIREKINYFQHYFLEWAYFSIVSFSKYLVLPAVLWIIYLVTIFFLSVIIFSWFRSSVIPKNVLRESIQFDYLSHNPTANISLFRPNKQWENFLLHKNSKSTKNKQRFLKGGISYDIDAELILAKSTRNYESDRMSIILSLFNEAGEITAKSIRPIILPYQTPLSLTLETILRFPLYAIGYLGVGETSKVKLCLMNDYIEPNNYFSPTQSIQINISSSEIDLQNFYITVLPKLNGIRFFLILKKRELNFILLFSFILHIYTICNDLLKF
jgi:hypothetical protein